MIATEGVVESSCRCGSWLVWITTVKMEVNYVHEQ